MLVIWSGGCDSTLMLYLYLIKEMHCGRAFVPIKEHQRVRAITFENEQMGNCKMQKKARDNFKKFMLRKHNIKVNHTTVAISTDNDGVKQSGLVQQPFWLSFAMHYAKYNEDVALGFIKGDDYMAFREAHHDFWKIQSKITGKYGKLLLPFEYKTKMDVISDLRKYKILKNTWWCENLDTSRACHKCHSCAKHLASVYQLDNIPIKEEYGNCEVPAIW